MKQLQTIIRTNERVVTALGHPYMVQLGHIYVDLLNVYKAYSELINTAIATSGATSAPYHPLPSPPSSPSPSNDFPTSTPRRHLCRCPLDAHVGRARDAGREERDFTLARHLHR